MLTSLVPGTEQGAHLLLLCGAITRPVSFAVHRLQQSVSSDFLLMSVTYFRSHNISGWISRLLSVCSISVLVPQSARRLV
jgi:uncharacterized membrane protein YphA (DoxX/SURF4 family)